MVAVFVRHPEVHKSRVTRVGCRYVGLLVYTLLMTGMFLDRVGCSVHAYRLSSEGGSDPKPHNLLCNQDLPCTLNGDIYGP